MRIGTMLVPPCAAAVLSELERHGAAHDRAETDRSRRMLNLERPTAELLALLVRAAGCRQVLEIGTSNGFSAVWLAAALAPSPDARLTTIERDRAKHTAACDTIERSGFSNRVTLLHGDATETVATLAGPFDAVFFDADRVSAVEQLALLEPKLAPDCLLLADNALSHAAELAAYRDAVDALPGFDATVVRVGKGLHVAVRRAGI